MNSEVGAQTFIKAYRQGLVSTLYPFSFKPPEYKLSTSTLINWGRQPQNSPSPASKSSQSLSSSCIQRHVWSEDLQAKWIIRISQQPRNRISSWAFRQRQHTPDPPTQMISATPLLMHSTSSNLSTTISSPRMASRNPNHQLPNINPPSPRIMAMIYPSI